MAPHIQICRGCEHRLTRESNAIRRHASEMYSVLASVQTGLTEEQVQQFRINLIVSFNDAQSAWDAYRAHLEEHGILLKKH